MSDGPIYHCGHAELAAMLASSGEKVDLLCVDAPYSAKTHKGHHTGVAGCSCVGHRHVGSPCAWVGDGTAPCSCHRPPGKKWMRASSRPDTDNGRRDIDYDHWTPDDVRAFVALWAPLCRGWIVSLTDDVLFPAWRDALADADLTTFQDVPVIIRGMTVRLAGDGPSSWGIHCAVARPKKLSKWGTLDGGYTVAAEKCAVVGGKPLNLMRALVRDYSRPGDLVCDPCVGGGTTLVAARLEGRRVIGCDVDEERARLASDRLAEYAEQIQLLPEPRKAPEQLGLVIPEGT